MTLVRRWLSRLDDLLLVVVVATGGWVGYERLTEPKAAPPAVERPREPVVQDAASALAALPVKGKAPKTGYDRDLFGHGWQDIDRNGCDARNDTLRRDLAAVVIKPGANGCVVIGGLLRDPYTGNEIEFAKPAAGDVPIDHVVPLADAWIKGAQGWDEAQRVKFANDPLNLLAISQAANTQKRDYDASGWLPQKSYRCQYVARQVAVKTKYGLWVTAPEHEAMARVLTSCPGEPLPEAI